MDALWQDGHLKQHLVCMRTRDMSQYNVNKNTEVRLQVEPPQGSLQVTKPLVRKFAF